jgi:GT2 family glycosyltransferase
VNWNSGPQLARCLRSIVRAGKSMFELSCVVVVDNASTDQSLEGLDEPSLPLRVIRNVENIGFAAACNLGVEAIGDASEYLLFLNPDTRLFDNSLNAPLGFMADPRRRRVGICGIRLRDSKGKVARSCARFPQPIMFFFAMFGLDRIWPHLGQFMREWDHSITREVDQVIGAFFLVRRELFESIGGFDTRFFVYLEDVDFSLRARRIGWISYYLAEADAFHKGGGTSEQIKARRLFYSLRSRLLYAAKHFSKSQALMLAAATLLVEPVTRLVFALSRGSVSSAGHTLAAYAMLYRDIPQIWRTARH